MAASLNFLSLTPKTLSVHNSSASSTAAPCLFTTLASIKPFPKLVLSVNYHARGTCSRFVRHVAVSSEVEEDEDEDDDFSGSEERSFSAELKLFVGNLPFNVDSAALADLFQQAGNVEMVEVIYDKITGRSRGFGFVTMSTIEEVEAAAQQFNGYEIQGRAMRVNFGPPPAKREDSFGSRGSRGGYGDGQRGGYNDRSRGGYGDGQRGGYGDGQRGGYGDKPRGGGYGERPRGGAGSDSSNRVYVGNLAWGVDNLALETLFKEQGKVTEARVVYDRESGRSRGFGFVTLGSPQEVKSAINSLDGIDLNGRAIRVSAAEARPSREY